MTEIRFYHLTKTPENRALPQIAQKAWQAGHRVVLKTADAASSKQWNETLWTYDADAFLPHGSKDDGRASDQPIWLTHDDDNPNDAKTILLSVGSASDHLGDYDLCCRMLDGRVDAQVVAAREDWRKFKEQGFDVSYWQETDHGWEKKA